MNGLLIWMLMGRAVTPSWRNFLACMSGVMIPGGLLMLAVAYAEADPASKVLAYGTLIAAVIMFSVGWAAENKRSWNSHK